MEWKHLGSLFQYQPPSIKQQDEGDLRISMSDVLVRAEEEFCRYIGVSIPERLAAMRLNEAV
jgi:hypothetical protein